MLTKNGKLFFAVGGRRGTSMTAKNVIGNNQTGAPQYCGNVQTNLRVYVGSGTTDPTSDDYTLESEASTLTILSATHSYSTIYDGDYVLAVTSTWRNNTASEVTITEVGIVLNLTGNDAPVPLSTDLLGDARGVLLVHQLIDPVKLEPGDTYAFTAVIGDD